jgi:hypothetical protein
MGHPASGEFTLYTSLIAGLLNEAKLREDTQGIQVELSPRRKRGLRAEAQAHGIAPEKYAGSILQEALASSVRGSGKLTVDELHMMLRQIAEGSEKPGETS